LSAVRRLATVPGSPAELGPCLEFPNQAQFNPIDYLVGLAAAIERRGGQIFTGVHVDDIDTSKGLVLRAASGVTVKAGAVVLATNSSILGDLTFDTNEAAYRTYCIAAEVPAGSIPHALYWDTSDTAGDLNAPYHFVRVDPAPVQTAGAIENGKDHDILIVGGEDHRTGQAEDGKERWNRLEEWARERYNIGSVRQRWSGQVLETFDGLAMIGRHPHAEGEIFVATGDSGMGLTHGTIAGLLLSDLVTGKPNPWKDVYAPARGPLRGAVHFAGENLNTMAQYTDWLRLGEVASVDQIPSGRGAVIRHGLKLLAVYRDADGNVHERSAVCPHRGGIVRWNEAEHSWDCPCHGSRFDPYGHCINGPANSELSPVDQEQSAAS
jgi:glycine/D-amino acid oxidase-like deaminating enzyme/nitrite reductase/ring-hydroxylating ferredoxin subunit